MKSLGSSASEKKKHDGKDCFILGSGRSLLELTRNEVNHINQCDFVLAFNKYLIFYEKIGVIPTHYLIGDHGEKAILTFREVLKVIRKDNLKIQLILSNKLIEAIANQEDSDELLLGISKSIIVRRFDWLKGGSWAKNINETIYHFRGSLSGAINITTILNPGGPIKLLGVDLIDHSYFFQEELKDQPEKWRMFLDRLIPESIHHETIETIKGVGGIQDCIPYIHSQVTATNEDLLCCNQNSYLVTKGLLKYTPVN